MTRLLLVIALLVSATPAAAADRTFTVTNFERIRVEGPFEVQVTVGQNGATARARGEPAVLDNLSVDVQGGTLVIRKGSAGWGERGKGDGPTPVITLTTPALRGAMVIGGGKLAIAGKVRTARLDLQVSGTASLDARGIDTEDLNVTMLGAGTVALAGKSIRARLQTSGSGMIAAIPLLAGDLVVRLDGPGETQASARLTADLHSTGLGRIVVAGTAKCTGQAQAGGPILCGPAVKP